MSSASASLSDNFKELENACPEWQQETQAIHPKWLEQHQSGHLTKNKNCPVCMEVRQSAGMPMPLGAGFAKILLAAQFDGSPRPRLLRSLLWPVGVIFDYWTVIWLSSLLLFVRAAEPNPPVLSGQRASIQSEHYWGRVCRKRHGELTGALPLRSAGTVHGVKGPLPLLLQSFSGSKTAVHRT